MDRLIEDLQRIFQDSEFVVHESLYDDLKKIFKNHGNAQSFSSILSANLKLLKEDGLEVALKTKKFERLTKIPYFYMRIRLKGKHNIRIWFAYSEHQELFLLAFDRKEGKGNSDHSAFISKANSRYAELVQNNLGGTHHEQKETIKK